MRNSFLQRRQKMKKVRRRGFTAVEVLIVVVVLGIIAAIIIPQLITPGVVVSICNIEGKKGLLYHVRDRYGCKRILFRDIGLDGTLDNIESDGLILDPNTVGWNTWVERFEKEVRPEAVGN